MSYPACCQWKCTSAGKCVQSECGPYDSEQECKDAGCEEWACETQQSSGLDKCVPKYNGGFLNETACKDWGCGDVSEVDCEPIIGYPLPDPFGEADECNFTPEGVPGQFPDREQCLAASCECWIHTHFTWVPDPAIRGTGDRIVTFNSNYIPPPVDPDPFIQFDWDFGDGTVALNAGQTVQRQYDLELFDFQCPSWRVTVPVTLTMTRTSGASCSRTLDVDVFTATCLACECSLPNGPHSLEPQLDVIFPPGLFAASGAYVAGCGSTCNPFEGASVRVTNVGTGSCVWRSGLVGAQNDGQCCHYIPAGGLGIPEQEAGAGKLQLLIFNDVPAGELRLELTISLGVAPCTGPNPLVCSQFYSAVLPSYIDPEGFRVTDCHNLNETELFWVNQFGCSSPINACLVSGDNRFIPILIGNV